MLPGMQTGLWGRIWPISDKRKSGGISVGAWQLRWTIWCGSWGASVAGGDPWGSWVVWGLSVIRCGVWIYVLYISILYIDMVYTHVCLWCLCIVFVNIFLWWRCTHDLMVMCWGIGLIGWSFNVYSVLCLMIYKWLEWGSAFSAYVMQKTIWSVSTPD